MSPRHCLTPSLCSCSLALLTLREKITQVGINAPSLVIKARRIADIVLSILSGVCNSIRLVLHYGYENHHNGQEIIFSLYATPFIFIASRQEIEWNLARRESKWNVLLCRPSRMRFKSPMGRPWSLEKTLSLSVWVLRTFVKNKQGGGCSPPASPQTPMPGGGMSLNQCRHVLKAGMPEYGNWR